MPTCMHVLSHFSSSGKHHHLRRARGSGDRRAVGRTEVENVHVSLYGRVLSHTWIADPSTLEISAPRRRILRPLDHQAAPQ